jgi:hypothetical protein
MEGVLRDDHMGLLALIRKRSFLIICRPGFCGLA